MASSLVATMTNKLRLVQKQQKVQQQQESSNFIWSDFLRKTGRNALAAATILLVASTNSLAALPPGPPTFSYTDEQIEEFMKTRRSYDVTRQRVYLMVDAPGEGSKCPNMASGKNEEGIKMKPGGYTVVNMCLEPISYTVRRPNPLPGRSYLPIDTKFITTYVSSFQGISGSFNVGDDGRLRFEGSASDNDATITLQLPGGGLMVKFAYALKDLVASGEMDSFSGKFSTLPLKDQDEDKNAGRGVQPEDSYFLQDNKAIVQKEEEQLGPPPSGGDIMFRIIKSNPVTGELMGEFESNQLSSKEWVKTPYSGLSLRSGGHKNVKTEGIWYARLQS